MTWETRLKQLIAPGINNYPYRIVQVKPNRQRDDEIYTLSGREEDIAANGALFLALYDLVERDRIDFDEWFKQWQLGFPLSNVNRETSNYPLIGENRWRKPGALPKFKNLTPPEIRHKYGWREIEYWKDSSNETDSVIMGGTDNMIVAQVIQYEYQGSAAKIQDSATSDIIRYSGIPEVTLFFKGTDQSLSGKNQAVSGQMSFRFMGHTDSPAMAANREDLKLITQTDINSLGAKIKSIFRTTPPCRWSKGPKQVIYHDWGRGYNLNIYCSNYAEGDRLVTTLLAIRDLQVDETFVKYKEAKNPAKAYPLATEIQVMGEKHKTPERLPTADVVFQYAKIYLPTIKQSKLIA